MITRAAESRKRRCWIACEPHPIGGGPWYTSYAEQPNGMVLQLSPEGGYDPGCIAEAGEHANDEICARIRGFHNPGVDVTLTRLSPGEFYPRIHRGPRTDDRREALRDLSLAMQPAESLFDRQREIFRTIHPGPKNLDAFGHEIRHLIILAATDVENAWQQILDVNSYGVSKTRFNTQDYVQLADPMRLREWEIAMPFFDVPAIRPFAGWTAAHPTKTLPWYDAYNAVKHHRDAALQRATVSNLLNAVAAVYVMLVAQFGRERLARGELCYVRDYVVVTEPAWAAEEHYVSDYVTEAGSGPPTWTSPEVHTPVPYFAGR